MAFAITSRMMYINKSEFIKQITLLTHLNPISIRSSSSTSIKVMPTKMLNDEEHNFLTGLHSIQRPKSPGLSIYKFELPAILSMTHRLTGVALSTYTTAIAFGAVYLPHDFAHYYSMLEMTNINHPTIMALKFMLAFPLTFHTVNGIRHLMWDVGKCLTIKHVYSTGYASIILSSIIASGLAIM